MATNVTTGLTREQIAQRVAQEFQDGYYVNLGIGIPTLAVNYIPSDMQVMLQSENGLLGMGPFPLDEEVDPEEHGFSLYSSFETHEFAWESDTKPTDSDTFLVRWGNFLGEF